MLTISARNRSCKEGVINESSVDNVVKCKNKRNNKSQQPEKERHRAKDNVWQLINELPLAYKDIKIHQGEDPETQNLITSVRNNSHNIAYYIKNDVLMYKRNDKSKGKIYLPLSLIDLIYSYFHTSLIGGHLGLTRSIRKVSQYFYRPNLSELISNKVRQCDICKMSKPVQRKHEGQLVSVPAANTMDCVFIDLLGKLPRTRNGNQYLLIMVDSFSKFVWLFGIKDCTSSQICKKLDIVFNTFSVPRVIVSDNASYFTSNYFKQYLFKSCIEHRRIAAYRANGNIAERYLRNTTTLLRAFHHDDHIKWDTELGYLQTSLNTAWNESTKFTAFNLMFNHNCNNALSNLWNLNDLVNEKLPTESAKENLRKAMNNIKKSIAHNQNRLRYSENNRKHPFAVNKLVWIRSHYLSSARNKFVAKLGPKYTGVYKIIYFLSPVTCLVQHQQHLSDVRKVHIVDLKLDASQTD